MNELMTFEGIGKTISIRNRRVRLECLLNRMSTYANQGSTVQPIENQIVAKKKDGIIFLDRRLKPPRILFQSCRC